VDAAVHAVLQQHPLVTVARRDHAAVHEVELDELCVGQVQVRRHQLPTAALHATGCEGTRGARVNILHARALTLLQYS